MHEAAETEVMHTHILTRARILRYVLGMCAQGAHNPSTKLHLPSVTLIMEWPHD
jgi:hypothetical protein